MIRSFHTAGSAAKARLSTFAGQLYHRTRIESLESRHLLSATIIGVDTFDDVVDAADGVTSLREAVIYANTHPGDFEIQLGAGTYELTIKGRLENDAMTGDLDILANGSVKIVGTGAATTTIDAAGLVDESIGAGDRIFDNQFGAILELEGLTLTGAQLGSYSGGAIQNFAGQVTITACVLSNNTSGGGAGIHNYYHGQLTIIDSILSNNSAFVGAAISSDSGPVQIFGSTISNNTATFAAGITSGGTLTVIRSTFTGNMATSFGGAILKRGQAFITQSTFSENSANELGGAIYNITGQMTIRDSALSANTAGTNGGAIFNFPDADITLINSSVSGNTADDFGGGIYDLSGGGNLTMRYDTLTGNRADADGDGIGAGGGMYLQNGTTAILENTIVAGNFRGLAPGGTISDIELESGELDSASSYNLVGDPATAGGLEHGTNGNIVGDGSGNPLDINTVLNTTLSDNGGPTLTHALVAGSPAINAGDPNFAPPPDYDQRGAPFVRVYGGRIDIGAFEVQVATLKYAVEQLWATDVLNNRQASALLAKLEFNGNLRANLNQISAFENQVNGFVHRGVLTQAEGELLIEGAESLRDSLLPPAPTPTAVDLLFAHLADQLERTARLLEGLQFQFAGGVGFWPHRKN
jgi:Chlamydia polymorphic membrane protein (Chlamydia_PMP) repeat